MSPSHTDGKSEANTTEAPPQTKPLSPVRSRSIGTKPTKPSVSGDESSKSSLVIKPSTYCERPGTKRTKEVSPSQVNVYCFAFWFLLMQTCN